MKDLDPEVEMVESLLRQQAREDQFWRLFELRLGTRTMLLLVAVSLAIPAYLVGANKPLTGDWTLGTIGLVVILMSAMGLVPAFALRTHFVEEPGEVHRFMADWRVDTPAKEFVPAVLRFVKTRANQRARKERKVVQFLVALDGTYSLMLRRALWLFPLLALLAGTVVILMRALAQILA